MNARALTLTSTVVALLATLLLGGHALAADAAAAKRFEVLSAGAANLYEAGQYEEAIAEYLKAYDVVPSGEVLYNVAFIYDKKLGETSLAKDFYKRVLRSPETSSNIIALATNRVRAIEQEEVAARTAAEQARAEARAAEERRRAEELARIEAARGKTVMNGGGGNSTVVASGGSDPNYLAYGLIGGGGAMVLGGIIAGIVTLGTESDFNEETDAAARAALKSDGEGQAVLTDVLLFGGAAVAATGVVLLLLDDDGGSDVNVGFSPATDGGGVVLVGGSL